MKRLPQTRSVIRTLKQIQAVANSDAALVSKRSVFQRYETLSDLVWEHDDAPSNDTNCLMHNLMIVRNAVVHYLWKREVFIGWEFIEEHLFGFYRNTANPLRDLFSAIRDSRVLSTGCSILPMKSIGIAWLDAAAIFNRETSGSIICPEAGIALIPPCYGGIGETVKRIRDAMLALGIKRPFDEQQLRSYSRYSRMDFLTNNHLLVTRFRGVSWSGCEFDAGISVSARLATAFVALVHCSTTLERWTAESSGFSTRMSASYDEQRDLRFYVTITPEPGHRRLRVERQSISFVRTSPWFLGDASDLPITLNPNQWANSPEAIREVANAVSKVRKGYLAHSFQFESTNSAKAKLYRKLFSSLSQFTSSLCASVSGSMAVVQLASALEFLLVDEYRAVNGPTRDALGNRVELLVDGHPDTGQLKQSVIDLYDFRCQIVHGDVLPQMKEETIARAQMAFALSFVKLVERIEYVRADWTQPIRKILKL